ncbi:hypothetical protein BDV28DRAFT_134129 [Aspergillus coremiiformis]|uniref:Transcription factor hoxa13 n=1 Tax=Aspergillus coremiiformis TaxID=138285 RepID=A0A5N6Z5K7_9EURO|nr:hypothetical protein BDV28DRAFT_134129 [Aspergillus coremiiformis]
MATLDNGHASEGTVKIVENKEVPVKPGKTNLFRWTLGLVVRLCIWYILLTPFFRCPSRLSDLNESSPRVCKPYLVARSHIEPYVLPYYNTYGAPYVEKARPYVIVINEKVYTPAANVARLGYDKYGAPALDQAHAYGSQQWEKQVVPLLETTKDSARELYTVEVAPHVQRVAAVVSPYHQKANSAFQSACVDYIQPLLARTRPFIGKTYTSGQNILTTTVVPYTQNSWSSVVYFLNSWLWPKITGLYSENVEPQLVKIGQRLASYREEKQLRKVVDEVDSSPDPQVNVTFVASEASKTESPTTTSMAVASSTPHTLSPTELTAQIREKIESDLRIWEEKFTVAADKGLEDLEERLYELVEGYVNGEVKNYGESLVTALSTVVEQEFQAVKLRIRELTEALPSEHSPAEATAQTKLSQDIRQAAIAIRDHAHAIREWHSSFDQELVRRVSAAVNSTLDVLDVVRDLGLQEIGLRWAWMDGVTYKDWARYHALKVQLEDWKGKFKNVGMQHSQLEDARALSDDILARAMDTAEAAAKELARLKDVGKWKIAAREVSDNFDSRFGSPPPLPEPSDKSGPASQEYNSNHESSIHHEGNATDSTAKDTTESEEPALGFDHAPLAHDHATSEGGGSSSEESELSDLPVESAGPIEGHTLTAQGGDREKEGVFDKSTWGVAAAEIMLEQNVPDHGEAPEKLQSAPNKAHETHVEATSSSGANSFQSLHPRVGEQLTHGQLGDTQDLNALQISNPPSPQYEAVESLVSELLAGKDPLFTQNVMDKLHAIYGSSYPAPELQKETLANHKTASILFPSAATMRFSRDALRDISKEFQSTGLASQEQAASTESATSRAISTSSATEEPMVPVESIQEQNASFPTHTNTLVSEATETTTTAPDMDNSDAHLDDTPTKDDL